MEIDYIDVIRRTVCHDDFVGREVIYYKFKKLRRPRKEKKMLKKRGLWPSTKGYYLPAVLCFPLQTCKETTNT